MSRSSHPLFAALYDRVTAPAERAGLADRRRRLLSEARGRTLEIGAGTGANLRHYPAAVSHLVALEPDHAMRVRLLDRLEEATPPVEVHEAGIEAAPFEPASFDTVVSTVTLCTVPDLDTAVSTVRRLLKPDGRFLFLEHVRAPGLQGWAQKATTPVWSRVAGGCHADRDVLGALRGAGFVVSSCDRFTIPRAANPLVATAVQGVAVHGRTAA
jgi:SAM-dependent methyltransferase